MGIEDIARSPTGVLEVRSLPQTKRSEAAGAAAHACPHYRCGDIVTLRAPSPRQQSFIPLSRDPVWQQSPRCPPVLSRTPSPALKDPHESRTPRPPIAQAIPDHHELLAARPRDAGFYRYSPRGQLPPRSPPSHSSGMVDDRPRCPCSRCGNAQPM